MNTIKVVQTWFMLKLTYTLVPIVIGLDKFTGMITEWPKYVSPTIIENSPFSLSQIVMTVGVIEIIAGIIVWFYPRLGAYIIVAWLGVIIINLATMHGYYDIIARDVVIAIGALALAWLTESQKDPVKS